MPKFVLTIETETEEAARVLAKWIDEEILIPAEIEAAFDFTDFVGKAGELDV